MNKKIFGIIIIFFGLALIAGIAYFIFFYKFPQAEEAEDLPKIQEQVLPKEENQIKPLIKEEPAKKPTPTKTEIGQEDLKRLASAFAERFGSYSNQSDYGNISDLKIFMTQKMKSWADNYISQSREKKIDTSIYYGITTKSITSEVNKFDSDVGLAEILVKTQRREATGTTNNFTVFYQDIIINFIKETGAWKVNSAFWQNK